jgi:hypothetical protein
MNSSGEEFQVFWDSGRYGHREVAAVSVNFHMQDSSLSDECLADVRLDFVPARRSLVPWPRPR